MHVNPDFELGQDVVAFASLCDDFSPASEVVVPQMGPNPLATPTFGDADENGELIAVRDLAHGARFIVWRNGVVIGDFRASTSSATVRFNPPLDDGDVLEAQQRLCDTDPSSGTGSTTVAPCADLPAPTVAPIQAGDEQVRIIEMAMGARIKVFVNGLKTGDGGGSLIQLESPVPDGATVYVQQVLGDCSGDTVRVAEVHCVQPHVTGDPAHFNLFPIGRDDFDAGNTNIDTLTFRVSGNVLYPAESDGNRE
ncbi:MAG: hypothetical protein IH872_05695, partial [Chloroflexi bacterium]|nr:hypothetical protein [Chloroflexota bacterium]